MSRAEPANFSVPQPPANARPARTAAQSLAATRAGEPRVAFAPKGGFEAAPASTAIRSDAERDTHVERREQPDKRDGTAAAPRTLEPKRGAERDGPDKPKVTRNPKDTRDGKAVNAAEEGQPASAATPERDETAEAGSETAASTSAVDVPAAEIAVDDEAIEVEKDSGTADAAAAIPPPTIADPSTSAPLAVAAALAGQSSEPQEGQGDQGGKGGKEGIDEPPVGIAPKEGTSASGPASPSPAKATVALPNRQPLPGTVAAADPLAASGRSIAAPIAPGHGQPVAAATEVQAQPVETGTARDADPALHGKAPDAFADKVQGAPPFVKAAEATPPAPPSFQPELARATVPAHPAPAEAQPRHTIVAHVPFGAVPFEIGMRALNGATRFEIRLDPAELGRVDVRLEIGDDGTVKTHLTVDKVETLALLQRDARTLERAFEQAGLKPSEGGVDLTLRDQPGQGGRQQRPNDDQTGSPARSDRARIDAGEAAPAGRAVWRGSTGLDLHV